MGGRREGTLAMKCATPVRIFICLSVLTMLGCKTRRVGVEISGNVDKLTFSFRDCTTGKPITVSDISVIDDRELGPQDSAHAVCDVHPPAGPADQPSVWVYGVAPPGMIMSRCEKLRAGVTYTISTTYPKVIRSFRLREDGTPSALEAVCKE